MTNIFTAVQKCSGIENTDTSSKVQKMCTFFFFTWSIYVRTMWSAVLEKLCVLWTKYLSGVLWRLSDNTQHLKSSVMFEMLLFDVISPRSEAPPSDLFCLVLTRFLILNMFDLAVTVDFSHPLGSIRESHFHSVYWKQDVHFLCNNTT